MSTQTVTTVNGVPVEALGATIEAIQERPGLASFRFRARNTWINGGHNRVTVQDFYGAGCEDDSRAVPFVFDADEPPVLLGKDKGANPVEYVLTALSACMTTSMVYHAAARGIRIEELESEFEGDIDLRGFLGIDAGVRKGYRDIRVRFRVKSDASPEQLEELTRFSPVFDVVTNPVPVSVTVEKK